MEREQAATNLLLCGLSHGREHLLKRFGEELIGLFFVTFAELHKNNIPEEAFVFLLIKLYHRRYPSVDLPYEFDSDLQAAQILSYLKATPEFKAEKRLVQISDDRLLAVLNDFVYILSKQFFYHPEVLEKIIL